MRRTLKEDRKQLRKHEGDAPSTWGYLGQELGGDMKENGGPAQSHSWPE